MLREHSLMRRLIIGAILTFAGLGHDSLLAEDQTGSNESLPELLVTGERPGPGLWRVSKGEHELWILATLVPLPKKMVWRSREVQSRIASSQVVITPPQFTPDIGFFRGVALIPSLLRARHSPDGKSLEDTLPHDVYIRWLALRVKYLNHGDEKDRPMVAAFDLYSHALDQAGLTLEDDEIWEVVKQAAKSNHVPIEHINIKVPLDDPKSDIKGLSTIPRSAEVDCFEKTLTRVETDIAPMIHRANLWSLGDVDGLRAMPPSQQAAACQDAFLSVPQLQAQFSHVEVLMNTAWLAAAENALAKNVSSFTVLSIRELFEPDGLLAKLRADGYEVENPRNTQ